VADVAPVIALVAREEQALAAWSVGARGVLSREASSERLIAAVRAARSGLVVHEEGLSATPLRREGAEPSLEPLTPREMEVLSRMIQGMSNRRIADALGISEHTAKFHVNSILGKLGASTRTEAVVLAVRRGLVML
jgi:DNA-binding NarL/FixJ family response regulator